MNNVTNTDLDQIVLTYKTLNSYGLTIWWHLIKAEGKHYSLRDNPNMDQIGNFLEVQLTSEIQASRVINGLYRYL